MVGAGIIGLTCAVRLREAGARVTVLAADPPAATTSAVAAAVWYPTRIDADPRVLAWAVRTYDVLTAQAADGVPGARRARPGLVIRDPATATRGGPGRAVPDLVIRPGEWRFTVPAVEMGPYLDHLAARVGAIAPRRIGALAELAGQAAVVVNATGLAAGRLADDPAVHPVRGQVVRVANPGPDHVGARRGAPGRRGLRAPAAGGRGAGRHVRARRHRPGAPAGGRGGDPAPVRRRRPRGGRASGCSGTRWGCARPGTAARASRWTRSGCPAARGSCTRTATAVRE